MGVIYEIVKGLLSELLTRTLASWDKSFLIFRGVLGLVAIAYLSNQYGELT